VISYRESFQRWYEAALFSRVKVPGEGGVGKGKLTLYLREQNSEEDAKCEGALS